MSVTLHLPKLLHHVWLMGDRQHVVMKLNQHGIIFHFFRDGQQKHQLNFVSPFLLFFGNTPKAGSASAGLFVV